MHPELIQLPGGYSIKTYGFFLMIGFLSAVWFAMRRADRVRASSDRILDLGFFILVFGILGARIFYVVHYWKSQFAPAPNKLLAVVNITNGGLEFLGGFLGAFTAVVIYCWWTKVSIRLYLDIIAPSAMWGLAFGRVGCYFNGCCFGGLCAVAGAAGPTAPPWAVEFPYRSPAHFRHWEEREVTVPAELISAPKEALIPSLVPAEQLSVSIERLQGPSRRFRKAREAYEEAKAKSPDTAQTEKLKKQAIAAKKARDRQIREFTALEYAMQFPSRVDPERKSLPTELEQIAGSLHSRFVHPTQLYSAGQAMLLSLLLSAVFYARKRHGVVIGVLLLLYPIQRALLEVIRADNPHDVVGLTVSQSISVALFALGVVYLFVLYTRMPLRSPNAVEPDPDAAPAT